MSFRCVTWVSETFVFVVTSKTTGKKSFTCKMDCQSVLPKGERIANPSLLRLDGLAIPLSCSWTD